LDRAPTFALLFGFVFLIVGFVLATASPCEVVANLQVCVPLYESTGNILVLFGSIFLVLWVVLIAVDEMRTP
jgi:hypothetical protein